MRLIKSTILMVYQNNNMAKYLVLSTNIQGNYFKQKLYELNLIYILFKGLFQYSLLYYLKLYGTSYLIN